VKGAGCRVQGVRCRVQGAGCRVQGVGCRLQGAGRRVLGEEHVIQPCVPGSASFFISKDKLTDLCRN